MMDDSFDVFLEQCLTYQQALSDPSDQDAIERAAGKQLDNPDMVLWEIYLLERWLGRYAGIYVSPTVEQAQDLVYLRAIRDGLTHVLPASKISKRSANSAGPAKRKAFEYHPPQKAGDQAGVVSARTEKPIDPAALTQLLKRGEPSQTSLF